jgi:zinc D-Ala-D-Ala carboxypeptidase
MPFVKEAPLAREALAESRTLRGTGAAGIATIGAAGVKVAQRVLAEARGALLPLVQYLASLRCVFIALALGGIIAPRLGRWCQWRVYEGTWGGGGRSPRNKLPSPTHKSPIFAGGLVKR